MGTSTRVGRDRSKTICGRLQNVFTRMEYENNGFKTAEIIGATRTEAGLHACGQTACFCLQSDHRPEEIKDYFNWYLWEDIVVKKAETVLQISRLVFSAKSILYQYRICTDPAEYLFQQNYLKMLQICLTVEQDGENQL